jgi:hypothetical protein
MIYKNPLATHATVADKARDYYAACANGEYAYYDATRKELLSLVDVDRVEFIGGLWRVQIDFPYKIERIRDKDFIILKKLPRQEKNLFDFYVAESVSYNCYGPYTSSNKNEVNSVVAKYKTSTKTCYAYGNSIEQARAFLGIRLYDEYCDLIHNYLCNDNQNKNQK